MRGSVSSIKANAANARGAPKQISEPVICGAVAAVEMAAIVTASALAYSLWLVRAADIFWPNYVLVTLFGALVAVNLFHAFRAYSFDVLTNATESLKRMTVAWSSVGVTLVAISFFTKSSEDYSRAWSALWFASGWMSLAVIRITVYLRSLAWVNEGRLTRDVAILGDTQVGERLVSYLRARGADGVRVVGVFRDGETGRAGKHDTEGGTFGINRLVELVRRQAVDTVVIALPPEDETRILKAVQRLKSLPVDIRLCPGPISFHLERAAVSHLAHLPLLNVLDRPLAGWQSVIKQIEDRVLAALILLLISPVLAAIALLIKIDSPGPVLFRQQRYGFNNHLIEVLKFRTMRHDMRDETAEVLTRRNDPRITGIGAILRKYSLDELPQFFNVLRGEMSIVGPRPHAISAKAAGTLYDDAVRDYAARHRVKPGITGWAQVNGWRGETETLDQIRQRVAHDLVYIENWSLGLDLKIILMTLVGGFTGKNAF